MDNFLKKLGFVDYLEMEFPMSKETLLKKLRSKVDYGSDDFGTERVLSPKKVYYGIIRNSSIQLEKKISIGNSSRSYGIAREEDGKTFIHFEIVLKPYLQILTPIVSILLTTIFAIIFKLIMIVIILFPLLTLFILIRYKLSITSAKWNLKRDLVRMLSEE